MNLKKLFYWIIVLVLVIAGFLYFPTCQTCGIGAEDIKYVKIAGQMVKVDLALTKETQERGLSGRKSLAENEGMLFIFSKPAKNYFWMKDMNFPIDIIWFDEDFKVIYIKKDAEPKSFPDSFGPGVDNRYVLEVSTNFAKKNNLKVGDKAEFLH